jgi:glycosyltransferase involved in cell wall biosynthesis
VVASSIPPHLEVLESEAEGRRLCPPGDADALLGALQRSLADPEAERAGAAGLRRAVLAGYRWEDATTATEDVYRRVLSGRRNRRIPAT